MYNVQKVRCMCAVLLLYIHLHMMFIYFFWLQVFALEKLNKIVDVFWAEISENVDKM